MTTDTTSTPEPSAVTCTCCQATTRLQDHNYSGLWDAGWRWIGSHVLYSCPACSPVIVVNDNGSHRRGPGHPQLINESSVCAPR